MLAEVEEEVETCTIAQLALDVTAPPGLCAQGAESPLANADAHNERISGADDVKAQGESVVQYRVCIRRGRRSRAARMKRL